MATTKAQTTSMNLGLPTGFVRIDGSNATVSRLVVAASGREKQGKTHFALTAPGPIAYFDLDIGKEGVVEKFANAGKDIYNKQYDFNALRDLKKAGPLDLAPYIDMWEKMRADYLAVLESKVRTVVIDTATEVWELLRMARFGKLSQVMPHQYGPVNAEYRGMLRSAYLSDKNLILLHKMKAEYIKNERTGAYERAGFSDTGFLVQVNINCWRVDGEFGITVVDCRQNPDMAGMEMGQNGLGCDFPTVASMIAGNDAKDWK